MLSFLTSSWLALIILQAANVYGTTRFSGKKFCFLFFLHSTSTTKHKWKKISNYSDGNWSDADASGRRTAVPVSLLQRLLSGVGLLSRNISAGYTNQVYRNFSDDYHVIGNRSNHSAVGNFSDWFYGYGNMSYTNHSAVGNFSDSFYGY